MKINGVVSRGVPMRGPARAMAPPLDTLALLLAPLGLPPLNN